jgi:hypothetical protein
MEVSSADRSICESIFLCQREAELLELLADHKIHEMREVHALDDTCSLLERYHLAEGLKRRKLVDYVRTPGIIRLR